MSTIPRAARRLSSYALTPIALSSAPGLGVVSAHSRCRVTLRDRAEHCDYERRLSLLAKASLRFFLPSLFNFLSLLDCLKAGPLSVALSRPIYK